MKLYFSPFSEIKAQLQTPKTYGCLETVVEGGVSGSYCFSKPVVNSAIGSAAIVPRVGQQTGSQGKETGNSPPHL